MAFQEDEDTRKLVLFYIVYTCLYFPLLFCLMIWSKGIDIVGKYGFQSYLFMIVVAETTKFFAGRLQFQRKDYNLTRRVPETGLFSNACRLIFNRANIKEAIKIVLVCSLMTVVYILIAVLYGAEVFDKHEQTIMFATLLSILTSFPMCLKFGPYSLFLLMLGIQPTDSLEILLGQNVVMTLAGAWIGAIAIPLDWDRPWQVWPIPCSIGALIGFLASHVIMIHRIRTVAVKKHK